MRKIHLIQIALIALSTLLMAMTCDDPYQFDESHHPDITAKNKGDKTIYIGKSFTYPDTIGGIDMSVSLPDHDKNTANPGDWNSRALSMGEPWENFFESEEIGSDTLIVYVFDKYTLESHPTSIKDALIQSYYLSLQDLYWLDWELTYPPDLSMKYVKMWPPFNEQ